MTTFGWLAVVGFIFLASLAVTDRLLNRNASIGVAKKIGMRRRVNRHVLRRW